ncbi:MAG TPA: DUF6754 domain-containing protein [Bacillota bacterium]|jgi:hypothetical protein
MLLAAEAAKEAPFLGVFSKGMFSQFVLLLIFLGIVWFLVTRARAGMKIPEIRKINGLEALDEAIGRATEMGRPVHFTPGLGGMNNQQQQCFAAFGFLSYVAKLCAKYDTRLIQTNADYVILAINEEIVKQAYLEAGRPDAYNPDDIQFMSDQQFAYASNVMNMFQKEKPAANIMIGAFWAESLLFAETASFVGAIQIAGTAQQSQLPFFITACDYTLIGEEIYAASAYLSKEPVMYGSLVGQDWAKIFIFALIIAGTVIANLGVKTNWLTTILKM